MTEPESWLELAAKFETLDPEHRLALIWFYAPTQKRYLFGFEWNNVTPAYGDVHRSSNDSDITAAKFEAFAARAGRKLGKKDPQALWQTLVVLKSKNARPGDTVVSLDGEDTQVNTGVAIDPCKKSAQLCYLLEANPDVFSFVFDAVMAENAPDSTVKVVQAETTPPAQLTVAGKSCIRLSYRAEVRAWIKKNELTSIEAAAKSLGVSGSALKSIMTDKGQKRYGDETLQRVLDTITHR